MQLILKIFKAALSLTKKICTLVDCAVVAVTSSSFGASPAHSSSVSTDDQSSSNVLIMSLAPEEDSPLRETQGDPFSKPRWMRYVDGLCLIIISMVIVAVSVTIALVVEVAGGAQQIDPHGGITSNSANCSQLGIKMLKSVDASTGDAAVFTALCLCVTHPHAASLGGGGFALVHNQKEVKNATHLFNFRESSSDAFSNTSIVNSYFTGKTTIQVDSTKTVAVPGLVKGLYQIHQQHGKVSWQKILNMVSNLAADGVNVSRSLANAINQLNVSSIPSSLRTLITKQDNITKLKEGDILKQPTLAKTLKIIGKTPDALYTGSEAQSFVEEVNSFGGLFTLADLKNYVVKDSYKVPETKFGDMDVLTAPSPTFGPVLHSVINTMSQFSESVATTSDQYMQTHRLAEALKYSFSLLSQLGNTSKGNYTTFGGKMSNESIGTFIASQINDSWSYDLQHYLNNFQPVVVTTEGQQYVSAVGPDGFAITIAICLGSNFGSKHMAKGFLLNDAMRDFSWSGKSESPLAVSKTNYIAGNARPLSSLVPTLIIPKKSKCGHYVLPSATPGYLSVSCLAQYILNKAANNSYNVSVAKPRFNQQLDPYPLVLENSEPEGLETFLRNRGHNITRLDSSQTLGKVNLLVWTKSNVTIAEDPRDFGVEGFTF
uniref:Glutathione hydrolase n=1 Tax=Phallusia mammillata TaxID=59560 RepID=A0A6F9DDS2_9ASCI|nr:gamma-glutamyltransferase 7 [Phallusia mammillata]